MNLKSRWIWNTQLQHCVATIMFILLLTFLHVPLCSCLAIYTGHVVLQIHSEWICGEGASCKAYLQQCPVTRVVACFMSTLVFNGVSYTGDTGRNKKEAEQLAARIVILSLPGILTCMRNWEFALYYILCFCSLFVSFFTGGWLIKAGETGDSGSLKILYEIIKSKRKLYNRVKDQSHSQPNIVHGGVKFGCFETTISQEQEVRAAIVRDAIPQSAISPATSGIRPPHHEFNRLRADPTPFPIAFTHLVSEQGYWCWF